MRKIISSLKPLAFFILYLIPLCFVCSMSFPITEAIRGKENDIWIAVLLAISFACIWSVLYIQIAKRIIKTDIKLLLKSNKLLYLSFAVIAIVFTMLSWFNEIPMPNPTEGFKVIPFLSLFAFLGWIVLTGMIVVCLGLFFGITSVALKLSDNHPKIVSIIALVFLVLWSLNLFGSGTKINPKTTVELYKIFIPVSSEQNSMNGGNDDWYFVYNNRIYVYLLGDYEINKSLDVFFSIDLGGKDKKIISDSEELRLAQFYAVKNGEAYYFSSYDNKNRKINLETGKISMTDKTYADFPPKITAETLANYNINAKYDKKRIKHINRQDNIVYIVYYEGPLDDQAYYNFTPENIKVYKHSLPTSDFTYVPNEIVVTLKDNVSSSGIVKIAEAMNAIERKRQDLVDTYVKNANRNFYLGRGNTACRYVPVHGTYRMLCED